MQNVVVGVVIDRRYPADDLDQLVASDVRDPRPCGSSGLDREVLDVARLLTTGGQSSGRNSIRALSMEAEAFVEVHTHAHQATARPLPATLMFGPFNGDTGLAVQDWIVSHGQAVMQRVKEDPDRLVELAADRPNARIDCAFVEVLAG